MKYKRIPIFDNKGEEILSHMDKAIAFIIQAKHYGNILVHCNQG
jgi:protein-tyrosine phosphatase